MMHLGNQQDGVYTVQVIQRIQANERQQEKALIGGYYEGDVKMNELSESRTRDPLMLNKDQMYVYKECSLGREKSPLSCCITDRIVHCEILRDPGPQWPKDFDSLVNAGRLICFERGLVRSR